MIAICDDLCRRFQLRVKSISRHSDAFGPKFFQYFPLTLATNPCPWRTELILAKLTWYYLDQEICEGFRHSRKLHHFVHWTMVIKVLVLDSQDIRAFHLPEGTGCSSIFCNIKLTVNHLLRISPFSEFVDIAWRCGIGCPASSMLLQRHGCYSLKGYSDLPELSAPPTPGRPARHHDNPHGRHQPIVWYMMVRHSASTTVDMGQHNSYYAGGQGVGDALAGQ